MIESINNVFSNLEFLSSKLQIKQELVIVPEQKCIFQKIYGDQQRYEQILMNFISNALKFSQKNGSIMIEVGLKSLKKAKDHISEEASEFSQEQKESLK